MAGAMASPAPNEAHPVKLLALASAHRQHAPYEPTDQFETKDGKSHLRLAAAAPSPLSTPLHVAIQHLHLSTPPLAPVLCNQLELDSTDQTSLRHGTCLPRFFRWYERTIHPSTHPSTHPSIHQATFQPASHQS
ncbi:uncharacterized protein UV8b_03038 [Ustilaginoidea virens]|uniref:Uncharacterized protein n=1 Tax=Ustilaginoidea virens TaxID=1159556 RepID=A0A8E5MGE4_USTVR|nr:uncharacterized protein UV8b_03038 [Ustilaginoidea virens]QUC18797.1 hypothetical protein UV8b_03038 [Ustilaginoidea virens]